MANARIEFEDDGTPFAPAYGDVYRSRSGARQAASVFVEGNDVVARAVEDRRVAILETGFGLGLNFVATLEALRPLDGMRLVYRAIELHPVLGLDMARAHSGGGAASEALLSCYAELVATGTARFTAGAVDVELGLVLGDGADALREFDGPFDALYLDGFSPDRNPGLWNDDVYRELSRSSARGTTLASYTVARRVRTGLTAAGFHVWKAPGFGAKRFRLAGEFRGKPGRGGARLGIERAVDERQT